MFGKDARLDAETLDHRSDRLVDVHSFVVSPIGGDDCGVFP